MEKNYFKKFDSPYIQRVGAGVTEKENERMARLKEKVFPVEYKEQDEVRVENDKLALNLDYSFAKYSDYVWGPDDLDGLLGNHNPSEGWRRLDRYVYTAKKDGRELDLLSDLPRGYRVLFNPWLATGNGAAMVQYEGCTVEQDVATREGILVTLHEIGHCIDCEKRHNPADRLQWLMDLESATTEEDIEFVLRKERDAWGYVLKKLRPFLEDLDISHEDILDSANASIFTRNKGLKDKLSLKNKVEKMFRFIRDDYNI